MATSARSLSEVCAAVLALVLMCGGPAAAQLCGGDCNSNSAVTVDELLTMVNVALGSAEVESCLAGDAGADGQITVDEILVAVNRALDGCPVVPGELTFDKISVATFPEGRETIGVTAKDASGAPDDWTVRSSDEAVVRVLKVGDRISVTGVGLGRARVTVLTTGGLQRTLPVRVYDPKILDVGEILITYVDRFTCRWDDSGSHADLNGSFYQPVTEDGWKALGSLGTREYNCPNVNGQQWMMVVKAGPHADPVTPPLASPVRYEKEWDDAGTGSGVALGAFWTPICPEGYVAMGTVVTAGRNPPPPDDVTCVRLDLTIQAKAAETIWNDRGTGGDVAYQGSFRIIAPENFNYEFVTTYLETGTFVTQGQYRSCSGEACWQPPGLGGHEVMNVLAVELPMLIDTPRALTEPRLTSYDPPPSATEPIMARAILVPFTVIGFGDAYGTRGLSFMVNNSPFVRAERVVRWGLIFSTRNTGSVEQTPEVTFTKGVSKEDSTTFSHTVGIELSVEGGVSLLAFSGSRSATISYQFGYESQHSVGEFYEEETTFPLRVPPQKRAAVWQNESYLAVRVHNLQTHLLEQVTAVQMFDSLDFFYDDYPDD